MRLSRTIITAIFTVVAWVTWGLNVGLGFAPPADCRVQWRLVVGGALWLGVTAWWCFSGALSPWPCSIVARVSVVLAAIAYVLGGGIAFARRPVSSLHRAVDHGTARR